MTCSSLSSAEGEADVKGSQGEQDESLLDNWIKELESGIKGMADLTGAPAEVSSMYTLGIYAWGEYHMYIIIGRIVLARFVCICICWLRLYVHTSFVLCKLAVLGRARAPVFVCVCMFL